MTWTLFRQQQQRGAQLHARPDKVAQPGEVPGEAVKNRAAQDHEQAGGAMQPGESPASPTENRDQDNTPSAPDPSAPDSDAEWDRVVQPQRAPQGEMSDEPPPEGK